MVALSHFKLKLLGERHDPLSAQGVAVMTAIEELCGRAYFAQRAWEYWYAGDKHLGRQKLACLDHVLSLLARRDMPAQEQTSESPYLSALVAGGLVKDLRVRTSSNRPGYALLERALNYEPESAVHLHADAVDVAALSEGTVKVQWHQLKALASTRVLSILHKRWKPHKGTIYQELPSKCVQPAWHRLGLASEVTSQQVYQLLFALAADGSFLTAEIRPAWALDLATAALSMHALGWSDRYVNFGPNVTDAQVFWRALYPLFFADEARPPDFDDWAEAAACRMGVKYDKKMHENLSSARRCYARWLAEHGLSCGAIFSAAMRSTEVHPIIYRG